jgi:hypothetical protein
MEPSNEHRDNPGSPPGERGPYGQLRKRNERRERIARLLESRRKQLGGIDRISQLQRERHLRQGR